MRRRYRWSFPLMAVATAVPFAAPPPVADAPPPAVVYVPGEPHYVAGPGVKSAEWSPDGRYALVVLPSQRPQGPDFRLVLWSRRTGRAAVDWTPPWPDAKLRQVVWFAGSHTVVALIQSAPDAPVQYQQREIQRPIHVIQLEPSKRTGVERFVLEDLPSTGADASPTQPLIVLSEGGEWANSLWFLTPDAIGARVDVPVEHMDGYVWGADGKTMYFRRYEEYVRGAKPTFSRFDPVAGTWKPLQDRPSLYRRPEPPFHVARRAAAVRNGDGRGAWIHPLWLVSGEGQEAVSELLAPDGDQPRVTAQGDAVLYLSGGLALFREVSAQERTAYLARRREADVETTRRNAKEIGSALVQYGLDYRNSLPPNNDSFRDALDAQVRSEDAWLGPGGMEGFRYTYPGGFLNPGARETTVVGQVPSVGGRFDVYGDGHVQWVPNP